MTFPTPTHKDAAEWLREYWALKHPTGLVDADGVSRDYKQAQRAQKRLAEALRAFCSEHGTVSCEGVPSISMKERRIRWIDILAVQREAPELFKDLLLYLKPDWALIDANVKSGHLPPVTKWTHEGRTEALVFEDE